MCNIFMEVNLLWAFSLVSNAVYWPPERNMFPNDSIHISAILLISQMPREYKSDRVHSQIVVTKTQSAVFIENGKCLFE